MAASGQPAKARPGKNFDQSPPDGSRFPLERPMVENEDTLNHPRGGEDLMFDARFRSCLERPAIRRPLHLQAPFKLKTPRACDAKVPSPARKMFFR